MKPLISVREKEILKLLAEGFTDKEVATKLERNISTRQKLEAGDLAPFLPLASGQEIVYPIRLYALPGFTPGNYTFTITIVGEK